MTYKFKIWKSYFFQCKNILSDSTEESEHSAAPSLPDPNAEGQGRLL